MTDSSSPRQFEVELEIQAPRDVVWSAIAEAEEIARWFAPQVEVDPGVGGRMVWQWRDLYSWPLTIDSWEPGRHLRTRYASPVDDGEGGKKPLFIDFHLEGEGGTTTVRLVHSGFDGDTAFDEEYDGISRGWPVELHSLRLYLEKHRGQPRAVAFTRASTDVPPDEAWRALCGPEGLGVRTPFEQLSPGDRYAMTTSAGVDLEGVTLCRPTDRDFSGTVDNLNDGFFHLWLERQGETTAMWIWLGLYDVAPDVVDRCQQSFEAAIQRVFPGAECAVVAGDNA